jgi:hypothetical protein
MVIFFFIVKKQENQTRFGVFKKKENNWDPKWNKFPVFNLIFKIKKKEESCKEMNATYPSGVQLTDLHERRPLCRDCDNRIMKEKRIRKMSLRILCFV